MGDRGAGRGQSCGRRGLGPRQPSRAVCLHRILVPTGAGSPLGTSVLKLRVIPQGDLAVAVIRPKVKADWAKAESLLCPVRPADAPRLPPFLLPPCQIARPRGFSEPPSEGALSRGPQGARLPSWAARPRWLTRALRALAGARQRRGNSVRDGGTGTSRLVTRVARQPGRWQLQDPGPRAGGQVPGLVAQRSAPAAQGARPGVAPGGQLRRRAGAAPPARNRTPTRACA